MYDILSRDRGIGPATARQASGVEGQSCTDGNFDGTCEADGFCNLFKPPNELVSKIVPGQCDVPDNSADEENQSQDPALFEGQPCTDGNFDGTCAEGGFCDMFKPPNELDSRIVIGQCGVVASNAGAAEEEEEDEDPALFEGQSCTDGINDGTCEEDGFCNLFIPPNEQSSQIVRGQCGIRGGN